MFRRKKQERQRLSQQQKEDLYEKVKQQHLESFNITTEIRDKIITKVKHQVKRFLILLPFEITLRHLAKRLKKMHLSGSGLFPNIVNSSCIGDSCAIKIRVFFERNHNLFLISI